MKLHFHVTERKELIVDIHCCIELQQSRESYDIGPLYNSQFCYDESGEGVYLSKSLDNSRGGGLLLRMRFCPYCGHRFSITDIEKPIQVITAQ